LRAGRIVVTNYAIKAVDILLPELEKAFFDDRWQIRHSSVELVGSMMYQLVGINKRPDQEDEDVHEEATETQRAALVEVLGQERRDRILSALYIARQDISGIVRIAAAQVFKTLVSNPQKTVREMLPTMTNMIVKNLASADEERRQGSARTLGDIVRKFGQGTVSELLPVLQDGLHSHDAVHVQGICIALVEIMNSASKDQLETFQDVLCDAVREALRHPNPEVQRAAAESFEALQQQFPSRAIESIVPTLLRQLESDSESDSEIALVALREIMKGRSSTRILGSLLPSLTAVPISPVNAKALGSLIEAAGHAINPRLGSILQKFMDSLVSVKDPDWIDELTRSFKVIILTVDNDEGIRIVLTTLFSGLKVYLFKNYTHGSTKTPNDEGLLFPKQESSSKRVMKNFHVTQVNGQRHSLIRLPSAKPASYKARFKH
jgi:HEAT repeat protein